MLNSKYIVKEFDYKPASQGALCAVARGVVEEENDEISVSEIIGVGICRYKDYRFFITIDSIEYVFNIRGEAVSETANGLNLLLAEVDESTSKVGTVVGVNKIRSITRTDTGIEVRETPGDSSVMVDNLDARDTFALYALKTLMERADVDPLSCSENEMTWYCEAAYKWAAVMITQASKNKALLKTDSSSATPVVETELSTNTEKLLNNIAKAIEDGSGSGTDVSGIVSALKGNNDATVSAAVAGLGTTDNPFVISGGGGGGSTDVSGIVAALKASTDKTVSNAITDAKTVISGAIEDLSTINIGNSGLGRNANNPVYTHDESVASAITNKNLIGIGSNGLGRDENNKIHVQVYGAGGGSSIRKSDLAEIGADSVDSFGVFNGTGVFGWLDADNAASAVFPEGVSRNALDSSLQTSLKEGLLSQQSIRNYVNAIYNASYVKLCFAGYAQGLSTVYNFYPELRRNLKIGDYFILLGKAPTGHYGLCFKVVSGTSSTYPYAVVYIYNETEEHLPLQFSENDGFFTGDDPIASSFGLVNQYAANILNNYYQAYKDGGVESGTDSEYLADWRNTNFIVIVDPTPNT